VDVEQIQALLAEALDWHEAGARDKAHELATLTIAAALTELLARGARLESPASEGVSAAGVE
jgi:hypothetical protein